ncbi:MAG: glycosyltransferase family 2 protein [Candidatus Binatia bacterium]|nr:glycosyltransferase family 2 protein [Candidatus Binatia bacterium]
MTTRAHRATPAVSVIVLNYNGAELVRKCVEHLLVQTFEDYEIIVVDNASSDGSDDVLRAYEADERVRVVWSKENCGVPGGRNVGLEHARGDIIAFVDNDGYPAPTWLENAVRMFRDDSVGAVASLVFFNKKKIIVNGAGGTLNLRGYGGDHCFHASYEFANIPTDVLYPMGCGMLIRRATMDEIGPFDDIIFNYYDDVELGIAVWNAGKRVVVCPEAWIDHEYGSSTTTNHQKVYLCERNRIRTVFKFFPLRHLPFWFFHEYEILRYLRIAGLRDIPLRAWGWNLRHLGSALAMRRRRKVDPGRYWGLFARTWKQYPAPLPEEHVPEVPPRPTSAHVSVETGDHAESLLYGWYPAEHDGRRAFRWATAAASVLIRLEQPVSRLNITAISPREAQHVQLVARRLGELTPVWQSPLATLTQAWSTQTINCEIGPGTYELQLISDRPVVDSIGRPLGMGLGSLTLETADPLTTAATTSSS